MTCRSSVPLHPIGEARPGHTGRHTAVGTRLRRRVRPYCTAQMVALPADPSTLCFFLPDTFHRYWRLNPVRPRSLVGIKCCPEMFYRQRTASPASDLECSVSEYDNRQYHDGVKVMDLQQRFSTQDRRPVRIRWASVGTVCNINSFPGVSGDAGYTLSSVISRSGCIFSAKPISIYDR
jgi:hypothetical protein